MSKILVTPSENYVQDADGSFHLKNEKFFGYLQKIHITNTLGASGQLESVALAEVYWNHDRSMKNLLMDPSLLSWLDIDPLSNDDDDSDDSEESSDGDDELIVE